MVVATAGACVNILYITVPLTLALSFGFVWAFVWAARHGQFERLNDESLAPFNHDFEETKATTLTGTSKEGALDEDNVSRTHG